MATKQFYHDIDLVNVGQLIGARIQNLTTTERTNLVSTESLGDAHKGLQVWDTTLNAPFIWSGSEWLRDALVVDGDLVFKGGVDLTASLDNEVTAASGNQYVVTTAGTPSMTGVTFTPSGAAEVGDMIVFTSGTEAYVLQRNLEDAIVDADFSSAGLMTTDGIGNYTITTNNSTDWDAAYNDKINSANFGTGDGVLTLTQQGGGTITVDLDGRFLQDITSQSVGDLSDVTISDAATGEFLRYNGTAWVDSAIQTGDISSAMVTQHEGDLSIDESQITFASSFIELDDLSVGNDAAASGSGGLAYNNTTGVFTYTPPDLSSYLTSVALNDVTDVTIDTAADGDFLRYNGNDWVDSTIQDSDIAESAVTQHEAALAIDEDQLTFNAAFTTTASTISGAINELESNANAIDGRLGTAEGEIDTLQSDVSDNASAIGTLTSLSTSEKDSLVGAVNELDAELGTITAAAMGTSASTVSGAIAELEAEIDTNITDISNLETFAGSGTTLTGTTETTLAGAVNELNTEVGTLTSLDTTEKGSLVGAINEVKGNFKTYFATGVDLTADTAETIAHNLDLSNAESYVITVTDSGGSHVSVDVDAVNVNSLTLTSGVDITGLKVAIIGF